MPGPTTTALAAPPSVARDDLGAVWAGVLEHVRGALPAPVFELYFARARALALSDERLAFAVETDFARDWIRRRSVALLRDALFEVVGRDLEIEVEVTQVEGGPPPGAGPSPSPSLGQPRAPAPAMAMATRARARGLQPRFTFEAYVMGPGNRFAATAALAVAEAPAQAYNPLFVYGGVGLGKTHLLHAIGHFLQESHPELGVCYVSVETFTNEFINALRDGGIRSFKDRYRGVDVLLIDDIHALAGKEQTQEEFFYTFNALHEGGKQIVISSDRPPKAIATLEERLRSRFEMGLITDIQPPDLETRIAILQKRVQEHGYTVRDPDVLGYIATRVSTNVRSLEGALTRVVAHASFHHRPITIELANEALRGLYPAGEGGVALEGIQSEVCRYFGLSHQELTGQKRTRRIVGPRQVAMYLSRELTDASLPAIGRAFGGRDHTTVMYAVQKVAGQMEHGQGETYAAVRALTGRLSGTSAED